MKLPRRRYWLPLALLALLVVWMRLDVHYHIVGWYCGDAYYKGLPTSHWRVVIRREMLPPRNWYESVMQQIYYFRREGSKSDLFKGDVEAIPVLIQIVQDKDEDPQIRSLAAGHMTMAGQPPLDLILAPLRACLDDPDRSMRVRATWLLFYRDVDVPQMSKLLIDECTDDLHSPSKVKRQEALQSLKVIALRNAQPDRELILRTIYPLLEDSDRDVRGTAAFVINDLKKHRDGQKQPNP